MEVVSVCTGSVGRALRQGGDGCEGWVWKGGDREEEEKVTGEGWGGQGIGKGKGKNGLKPRDW